ncbi:putative tyrosyl-DNA phosphodiesterase [Lyophyllum shimeji]|uniref:Tyrosyl-DNA phosphodiesterase n=1 Tax=Lyophyllum shimeji TaxID=47721 RepID=A0A9P3Q0B1_LYOSH|nr:putative tyrosyl-DNA phosphodiesterase [Lyophyllum shimeji]
MDHYEDEDLARAIALSLQESKPDVIDLVDSDEDEDAGFQAQLKQALEASKAEASSRSRAPTGSASRQDQKSQAQAQPQPQPQSQPPTTGMSAFLSERAQLEKERRERQKRLRPEAAVEDRFVGDEEEDEEPELKEPPAKSERGKAPSRAGFAWVPTGEQFWNGEMRQTATQGAEPRRDGRPSFRLTEVLGNRSEMAFAIMSSYSLDFAWIYQFFDPTVPVIMVAQPDASGRASLKNVLPNWIKATPLLRGGRGCMHMKFMLLFYKTGRLRVVISTGNLVAYDWRDMENTVWLQDLPLRAKPIPHDPKAPQDFPTLMQGVLHSLNVQAALRTMIIDNHPDLPLKSIEELRTLWDWSNVKVHLVASLAGRHEGWPNVIKTGHPRIMQVVRAMGLRTGKGMGAKELVVECQGSSIGTYTTQWMNEFHWSARGESAEDWLDESKKRREKLPYPPIKIVFPTKTTVQQSRLGEQGGGTLFCRRRQWAAKNFPRDRFHDSRSRGGPVLMHSKMMIATKKETSKGKQAQDSDTEDDSGDEVQVVEPAIGWAYVGSHNFTPSAWGTLSGSAFNPVLNISNFEIGIIFPLRDKEHADSISCFERPPRKYGPGDEPWMQEESIYHQENAAD